MQSIDLQSTATIQFFDGRRSECGNRSKQTETVRPQFDERCEKQRERDSALGGDENDVELKGETDDEDMEDGEMEFDDRCA